MLKQDWSLNDLLNYSETQKRKILNKTKAILIHFPPTLEQIRELEILTGISFSSHRITRQNVEGDITDKALAADYCIFKIHCFYCELKTFSSEQKGET